MVETKVGDLFESEAQTLVNTVNSVGVMGKGIALEFKKRFPAMYEDYLRRCEAGEVKLGRPYLYKRPTSPWILNFPTKDHWRSVARLADIVAGLRYLVRHYREWGIESLAVPPLGCGFGGLEWRVVGPTLYRHLKLLEIPVELYAPHGTPKKELQYDFLEADSPREPTSTKIDPAWVALVEILARIEQEPYHWPIGRTMFQKIAYFATESGIPTGFEYRRGSYGPFASNVKAVITRLVNNGLILEERSGQMFVIRLGPTFGDAQRAFEDSLRMWDSSLEKVADLFMRTNRTRQAELAATVHFAAKEAEGDRPGAATELDVFQAVLEWKQRRKPPFSEDEIATTIRNLNILGWLSVKGSNDLPVTEEVGVEV